MNLLTLTSSLLTATLALINYAQAHPTMPQAQHDSVVQISQQVVTLAAPIAEATSTTATANGTTYFPRSSTRIKTQTGSLQIHVEKPADDKTADSLELGDGHTHTIAADSDFCAPGGWCSFNYTYALPGAYVVKLVRGGVCSKDDACDTSKGKILSSLFLTLTAAPSSQ